MTINIHIEAHPDRGDMKWQLDEAMRALGFERPDIYRTVAANLVAGSTGGAVGNSSAGTFVPERELPADAQAAKVETRLAETADPSSSDDNRLVGKASGDRARRTKAEIAEDAALEAMADNAGITVDKLNSVIDQVGRAKAEAGLKERLAAPVEKAAISTGEERVGPEDDAATAEQDAADEKAEVDASRDPEKPLTADDLKNAMGLYVSQFGIAQTQEDGPALFKDAIGAPPEGEQFWRVSLVGSQGQDTLKKAIDAWTAAAATGKRYVAKGA